MAQKHRMDMGESKQKVGGALETVQNWQLKEKDD